MSPICFFEFDLLQRKIPNLQPVKLKERNLKMEDLPPRLQQLSLDLNSNLMPSVLKERYQQEWEKFKRFLEENEAQNLVDEDTKEDV